MLDWLVNAFDFLLLLDLHSVCLSLLILLTQEGSSFALTWVRHITVQWTRGCEYMAGASCACFDLSTVAGKSAFYLFLSSSICLSKFPTFNATWVVTPYSSVALATDSFRSKSFVPLTGSSLFLLRDPVFWVGMFCKALTSPYLTFDSDVKKIFLFWEKEQASGGSFPYCFFDWQKAIYELDKLHLTTNESCKRGSEPLLLLFPAKYTKCLREVTRLKGDSRRSDSSWFSLVFWPLMHS